MGRFSDRRWMKGCDFLRSCGLKWRTFLLSRKSLVEKGKAAPAPDDIRSGRC
jgi:hypothetical protein